MTPDLQDDVARGAREPEEGDPGGRLRQGPADVRRDERAAREVQDGRGLLPGRARRAHPVGAADGVLQAGQGHVDGGHLRGRERQRDARRAAASASTR